MAPRQGAVPAAPRVPVVSVVAMESVASPKSYVPGRAALMVGWYDQAQRIRFAASLTGRLLGLMSLGLSLFAIASQRTSSSQ